MRRDIREYLIDTVEKGGSDMHLSAYAPACARLNGTLAALDDYVLSPEDVKELIRDVLTERQREEFEDSWDLDFALQIDGVGRFRGNAYTARGLPEAAFRFIKEHIPELEELGHYDEINKFCELRSGLILVTGTTGSGKTTTLASIIQRVSEIRNGVIVTLEDPIEYVFKHRSSLIKQREVGTDTKNFPIGLRQALRQDIDVIVISELRDLETIKIAITAAETGHLVFATLHTTDAPQTIDRLVDVFPPEQQPQIVTQLAAVLEGIVSQRLIPKADGYGRILATEVLKPNYAIRACIRDQKLEQLVGLMEIGAKDGNYTIDETITRLLGNGLITREEAIFNCRDRKLFEESKPAPKPKSIWTT